MLDPAIANPDDPAPDKPGRAYALYPAPLRHGLTMGELARWLNAELHINADLHVIEAVGWKRTMWWDSTGIPWVNPSPNITSLTSALLYPALVPLEGSNVSVGRGTATAFQRFGAPWLNAAAVARLLDDRAITGVRFVAESFTPEQPTTTSTRAPDSRRAASRCCRASECRRRASAPRSCGRCTRCTRIRSN